MNQALLDKIESEQYRKEPAVFAVGDTVKVHTKVVEGDKERIQIFSGVVIRRKIAVSSAVSPMSRASRVSNAMNPTMPNFADSRSGKIVLYSEHL